MDYHDIDLQGLVRRVRDTITGVPVVFDTHGDGIQKLVDYVLSLEHGFKELNTNLVKNGKALVEFAERSITVHSTFKEIRVPEEGADIQSAARDYTLAVFIETKHKVAQETQDIVQIVERFSKEACVSLKQARTKVERYQHDRSKLQHTKNELVRLAEKSQLDYKEHKKKFEKEQLVAGLSKNLAEQEELLKGELPILGNLMGEVINHISVMIYFSTLRSYYEIYRSTTGLKTLVGEKGLDCDNIVARFKEEHSELESKADQLFIRYY